MEGPIVLLHVRDDAEDADAVAVVPARGLHYARYVNASRRPPKTLGVLQTDADEACGLSREAVQRCGGQSRRRRPVGAATNHAAAAQQQHSSTAASYFGWPLIRHSTHV